VWLAQSNKKKVVTKHLKFRNIFISNIVEHNDLNIKICTYYPTLRAELQHQQILCKININLWSAIINIELENTLQACIKKVALSGHVFIQVQVLWMYCKVVLLLTQFIKHYTNRLFKYISKEVWTIQLVESSFKILNLF